jgi:group I intron endonuclease
LVAQAIKKYGLENLTFDVLYEGCEIDIKQLEIDLIECWETKAPGGYNLTDGGEGTTGWKHSKETREEMSKSRTGSRNGMYGKQHGKETRDKIRQKAKDRDPSTRTLSGVGVGLTGSSNPRAVAVIVNGKSYGCIKEAAEDLKCHPDTLRARYQTKGPVFNYEPWDSNRRSKASTGRECSETTKEKLRQKALVRFQSCKHPCSRKVCVNGTEYASLKEAAKAESINYSTLRYNFQRYTKTNSWPPGWAYLS